MPKPPPSIVAVLALLLIDTIAHSEQRLSSVMPVEAVYSGEDVPDAAALPDGIAAKAWAILDGKTGKPLWGFHDSEARPIASTTKIMTAWIILQQADKHPKWLDEEIRFSERAAATRGSSCRLKSGDRLSVRELLYGLLLPSGNDAAVALAEHFGPRLQSDKPAQEDGVRLFVAEMNRQAKRLKLGQTNFLDPHGLARNQASARDLGVLTWHAMQNKHFREYVKTRVHECEVLTEADTKRRVRWKNTNQLLEDAGCDGVKTGTTNAAGACLVASAHKGADHLLVVVLGSTSGGGRYEDTRKLLRGAWEQRERQREKPEKTKKQAMKTLQAVACVEMVLLGTTAPSTAYAQEADHRPTLFLVGDSTVKNGTRGQQGWGDPLIGLFDKERIKVENHAIGGRSSRTFQTEGRWDKILAASRRGDFVLIQMGHNDGGPLDDSRRARGTLRGIGDETREIDNPLTGKKEVVHTYGWYLRKYITDARAKGMTPIVLSPVPHCPRRPVTKGDVEQNSYVGWAEEVAKAEKALFINLNRIVLAHYTGMSPADIKAKYFTPSDNTHTSPAGAALNAAAVAEGLRELKDCPLKDYLLAERK